MALMNWSQELDVHVDDMNDQHKVLLDLMNKLFDKQQDNTDFEELQLIFDELATKTTAHFKDEEAYMDSISFPDLETHKIIHQTLLSQFAEHGERVKQQKKFDDEFFNFLTFWLRSHIMGIDTKYGNFAKAA
jgi:hemerythrin